MKKTCQLLEVAKGLWSLAVGLKVTGKNFVSSQLTVHYPRAEVDNLSTYRGHIELTPKEDDPFSPRCIFCGMCEDVCPSGCIKVTIGTLPAPETPAEEPKAEEAGKEGKKPAAKKKIKFLERFDLNYNLCSLCGMCVQSCPGQSLRFSKDVYLASYRKEDFEFELLSRLREQAGSKNAPKTGGKE